MNPDYHRAVFVKSASHVAEAPVDDGLEVAFAGRSNAGKSSAINTLTRQKSLARISKTPGRTQLLNFFQIGDRRRFVDLPGYGYAKVPTDVKKNWHRMMEKYLTERESLCGIVLVMDVRHPLTDFDWQMIAWCENAGTPLHVLLTKADKLKYGAAKNSLLKVQKELIRIAVPFQVQLFSALKASGIDEAHQRLDEWFGKSV
ncbi:MAG: ribosome biogenesis GTP-binding protein YihA/YsxC [Gammaproteobacteria bacterium]